MIVYDEISIQWNDEISIQECLHVSTRDGGTCYDTWENYINRISMDKLSFAMALKHSYSDYKFNVSTVSSKMVGTYTTLKTRGKIRANFIHAQKPRTAQKPETAIDQPPATRVGFSKIISWSFHLRDFFPETDHKWSKTQMFGSSDSDT